MNIYSRPVRVVILPVVAFMVLGLASASWASWNIFGSVDAKDKALLSPPLPPPVGLEKQELAFIIGQMPLTGGRLDKFTIAAGRDRSFVVQTSIDKNLQAYASSLMAKAKAPMAAMAIIEPDTGRVLALASWDRLPGQTNYAVTPSFPAASVFKIITAAAAIESVGLSPSSKIPYNGRPHTLYKRQLKKRKNKWTRWPSLRDSFAKSVNPVFGKLALHQVGPATLEAFALRFGFNQALAFELSIDPSQVDVPENNPYHLAEIGSGYNRNTTISPLHGALIAGAVVNGGLMMEPSVVRRVTIVDKSGRKFKVYGSRPEVWGRALTPVSAGRMQRLMAATVQAGTGRKTFRRAGRDRVLKHLDMGGKTGTIKDRTRRYLCDWFVGYAIQKKTGKELAVGVLVAHNTQRRGTKATVLARQAFRFYFDDNPHKDKTLKAAKLEPRQYNRPIKRKPSSKKRR